MIYSLTWRHLQSASGACIPGVGVLNKVLFREAAVYALSVWDMNKSQNQSVPRSFHSHKVHLFCPFGLQTEVIDFPTLSYTWTNSKKGPFHFPMKQHLTKLHYPLFLTVGQSIICIKFIGKVRPGNPLYPLIHNRVVPISTSVCLRSGSSSRPMATRTQRFSNFG